MKIENGRKYIVRSAQAGVFYGEIVAKEGDEVTMKNARCLWYWNGAASLMQLAEEGVKRPHTCKFTRIVEEVTLLGVCEILPCSDNAVNVIEEVPEWIFR